MADLTPKSILEEEIPARILAKPQFIKDINAVFEFVITGALGGTWTLDLTEAGGGKVSEGPATQEKKTIVTIGDQEFINIIAKKTNTQMSYMSGKLKVKGDMGPALKLTKLLG